MSVHTLYFDGGAVPNPGRCAGAFVCFDENYNIVFQGGKYIEYGTNNIGEYEGLLNGLKYCCEHQIKNLIVKGDSNLVVSQVNKKWKINNQTLLNLNNEIQKCLPSFDRFEIIHIPRKENNIADKLSDLTLNKKYSWIEFMLNQ